MRLKQDISNFKVLLFNSQCFLCEDSPLRHRRSRKDSLPGVWDTESRQQFVHVRNTWVTPADPWFVPQQPDEHHFDPFGFPSGFPLQHSVKWEWGSATIWGSQNLRSSTAEKVSGRGDGSCVMCLVVCNWADWVCPPVPRLSAAGLPWSLQHDDWSGALGAPAEGEVRLTLLSLSKLWTEFTQRWSDVSYELLILLVLICEWHHYQHCSNLVDVSCAGRLITKCSWPQRRLPEMRPLRMSPGVTALSWTRGKDTGSRCRLLCDRVMRREKRERKVRRGDRVLRQWAASELWATNQRRVTCVQLGWMDAQSPKVSRSRRSSSGGRSTDHLPAGKNRNTTRLKFY